MGLDQPDLYTAFGYKRGLFYLQCPAEFPLSGGMEYADCMDLYRDLGISRRLLYRLRHFYEIRPLAVYFSDWTTSGRLNP
jgi:hypothetical protein